MLDMERKGDGRGRGGMDCHWDDVSAAGMDRCKSDCEMEMNESVIQGCTKRLFPGCVKWYEKVVFCLPTAGRRTQFFSPHIHITLEVPFSASLYYFWHKM